MARQRHVARRAADLALLTCVRGTGARRAAGLSAAFGVGTARIAAAHDLIAGAMVAAVRRGGARCSSLRCRRGYGNPPCLGLHARAASRERP